MRILTFLHDAFGGRGGIAKFNRDLLEALCSHPGVTEVVCLPRVVVDPVGPLPEKLKYWSWTAKGNWAYVAGEAAVLTDPQWYDLVICGHVRLLRLMAPLRLRKKVPMGLILHGVDAWEPFGGDAVMKEVHKLDWFLAVSDFTKQKFLGWTGLAPEKGLVVPNTVDLAKFTPGPKNEQLVARYNLAGKRVLMGMARLDTRERYKGFDEVMEAMPDLLTRNPDLVYMICGDGSDKQRLQEKAASLGIGDRVIFTGYVAEEEKVDTYRLADVFLLAGWGEGFGIVLIEAMACAVPSIASNLDASSEAVMDGEFGLVCNPKDPADLKRAIEEALARPKVIPAGLETFGDAAFERRIHDMILGRYLKA